MFAFRRFSGHEWQLNIGNPRTSKRWVQFNYYQSISGVKAHMHIHRWYSDAAKRIGFWW